MLRHGVKEARLTSQTVRCSANTTTELKATVEILVTRVRDKDTLKKLNRQLEKVADSFGNIIDI